jgi:hypothetical protein
MTFDEHLKGTFDTLTDRLREEISRQLQSVVEELAASAEADRSRVVADTLEELNRDANEGLAAAVSLGEARGRKLGHEEGHAQGKEEGRRQAEEEGRAALDVARVGKPAGGRSDPASSERLVEAVRSLSGARSLSEILDTLVSCAGREATRAGVLLVRGGRLHGWRFVGFDPALDKGSSLDLAFEDAGIAAEAVRTNAGVTGDGERASGPSFAPLPPGRESVAVPLALSGQVVAVLYADQGSEPEPAAMRPETIEVLARHAARCLEALTAFKAARALMDRPESSDATASGASDGAGGDEDASARRYARLLVSEIKLYHEAAVVAGRRDGDLGLRLGGEIAHARVLYEQRVPPNVRQRADYFHDELVRTLANGDPNLLALET